MGKVKGVVEALTGHDLVTGEPLAPWERIIGVLPGISDVGKLASKAGDIAKAVEGASDATKAAAAGGDLAKAQKAADQADQGADLLEDIAPGSPEALSARQKADEATEALEAACFVAGTLVLTPTGYRAIETLQVGERVLASDPETGVVKKCQILQSFEQ